MGHFGGTKKKNQVKSKLAKNLLPQETNVRHSYFIFWEKTICSKYYAVYSRFMSKHTPENGEFVFQGTEDNRSRIEFNEGGVYMAMEEIIGLTKPDGRKEAHLNSNTRVKGTPPHAPLRIDTVSPNYVNLFF